MAVNFQDAPEQKEFGGTIPDGVFVKVSLAIRPGGWGATPSGDPTQDQLDERLFHASKSSDAIMLDTEMTVLDGQYKHQKIWQYFTIGGGNLNADGTSKGWLISKAAFRAMIDCACGLDPKDETPKAREMRIMRAFKDLDGIEFWARVGIQKGGDAPSGGVYPDKNTIAHIVTPNEPEWKILVEGGEVEPQPRGARGGSSNAPAAQDAGKPAWQRESAPAAAPAQQQRHVPAGPSWAQGQQTAPPTQAHAATTATQPNGAAPNGQMAEAGPTQASAGTGPIAPTTASPSNAGGPAWLRR